jgi:iron-sulfur cluster assembly protein
MIHLSENAKKAVLKYKSDDSRPDVLLRVGVKGGGCSGFSYDVHLDDKVDEKTDRVFEADGVKVVCDVKSLLYLSGMTLDYTQEMLGGGFKFINPNAKGTCGCGTSFNV